MNRTIITEVDKYKKGWSGGLPETPCGYGSRLAQTAVQRKWIAEMVGKYDIRTINDIGAGDLNWIGEVNWPHPVEYAPYDLVPRSDGVQKFDLIHEVPPKADLTMCLWVLNHMPSEHAKAAQGNLLASGSDYVMITWWDEMDGFLDLEPIEEAVMRSQWVRGRQIDYWIRLVKC